ncbi:hypothetical protein ACG74X_10190 [Marivita sp. S0852]|uniref:hypothetical protein n=1 Tax=Marivita sp. S0852 TaxID=3373893 RepID=UPI003982C07C
MKREKLKAFIKIVIERVILRSVYSKFASGLVILGVGLLVPDFREFIINRLIELLNWIFTAATIPPYETEDSIWPIIVALGLITVGTVIFIIGWRIDEKRKKEQDRIDAQPVIDVSAEPSWVYLVSGDKNEDNPLISTSVHISIGAGSKPLKLKKVEFFRYVDGCPMLMSTPTLQRPATDETIEFNGQWNGPLEPYIVPANEEVTLFLKREFRGPTMRYRFDQMERGDLEINLAFSLGNSGDVKDKTFFFRQDKGSLTPTDGVSKPHLLNDDVLEEALQDGVISQDENDRIQTVSERRRHLYIRDGHDFLSGYPELRAQPKLLELIRDAHKRVCDARDAKAMSANG